MRRGIEIWLMRTLNLDWADLELAFRDATGAESYIDRDSGEVVTLVRGFDDEKDIREKLKRYPDRFVRIDPVDKSFTQEVLRAFIERLGAAPRSSAALKKQLGEAFAGPGGIARAMTLLNDDKSNLAAFARFEQAELVRRVEAFLATHGLKAGSEPPAPDLFEGLVS